MKPQPKTWSTVPASQPNATHQRTSRSIRSRSTIASEAFYKKVRGILQIDLKQNKKLVWSPLETPSNPEIGKLTINGDSIVEVDKAQNKDRELIYIKEKAPDNEYIFSFKGEGNSKIRDLFYDILTFSIDDFYKQEFNMISSIDKQKLILLLHDDYLKFLFDEIVRKREIIKLDDFWILAKKFYPEKITFSLFENQIQPSRSDELDLKVRPMKMNYEIKKRLLNSYDSVKKLYEFYIGKKQQEKTFWREFMKNQDKNLTEIVGGINKICFTNEEEENMKKINLHSFALFDKYNTRVRYEKNYERVEKHMVFVDNYGGKCISVPETDYSESKFQRTEEYNRKYMKNIITSLNNYSSRKIEQLNFFPKLKRGILCLSNFSNFKNNSSKKDNDTDDEDEVKMVSSYSLKPQVTDIASKLAQMEEKQQTLTPQSYSNTFSKINQKFGDIAKKKILNDIPPKEQYKTNVILHLGNLISDLVYLYNYCTKNPNKMGMKRDEIKALVREIKNKLTSISTEDISPSQYSSIKAILENSKSSKMYNANNN